MMIRAQKVYWLAQIIGWTSLALLVVLSNLANAKSKVELDADFFISISVFMIMGITFSHFMRLIFIRLGWLNIKLGPLVPRILIMSIVSSAGFTLVNLLISFVLDLKDEEYSWLALLNSIIVIAVFFLMWNGLYFTVHFFQKSRIQEVKNLQLSSSHNEIELKNLRSQLNPHFLFNSLNSIRALIDLDPIQAKENITTLSNLLRKSLVLGKEQMVSLRDELDLVNDYLDLEKVRFEERLAIAIHHDEQLNEFPIPPFIIQTLVENAFKHGISQLIAGGTIYIETRLEDSTVLISVINDGSLGKKVDTGIGLQNTLRRLELQYGSKARFSLNESNGKVIANIELKEQLI